MNNLQIIIVLFLFLLLCLAIACAARRLSKPMTAETVRQHQLREAAVQSLQWAAQAEHATAMSLMYAKRYERLGVNAAPAAKPQGDKL